MTDYNILYTNDSEQIINVWHNVFGDTKEEIMFFLNNCKNIKCLGLFVNGKLVSMLFLVDCKYGNLSGEYIYAVATLKEYRKNGYAAKLIEFAKEEMKDFLWLIPANLNLFDYYKKFGFDTKLFSDKKYENYISFNESEEIKEYLYDGSDFDYPKGMVFSNKNFEIGNTGFNFKE